MRAYIVDTFHCFDDQSEGKALSGIIFYNRETSYYQLTASRLYIAMVEELAPLYYPDVQQRVKFLNTIYERRNEMVELCLKGNDRLADALEKIVVLVTDYLVYLYYRADSWGETCQESA